MRAIIILVTILLLAWLGYWLFNKDNSVNTINLPKVEDNSTIPTYSTSTDEGVPYEDKG